MKIKQLFLFAAMLVVLMLAMTACELPFDIPFLNSEATTVIETTTAPEATTTKAIITLPPTTAAPNPIAKVESKSSGLRLVHKKGTTFIDAKLAPTEGRNGVTYSYTFDKDNAILTLTLYDGVAENIALQHLGKELPAPIKVCLREENGNIEWAYEGNPAWSVLCKTADSTVNVLALLCDATGFAANDAATGTGVTFVISGNDLRFRARMWQNDGKDICTDAYLHSNSTNNFLIRRMVEIGSTLPDNSMDGGTQFKSSSDEIPAISINGTYIAGCHGYYLISSVPSGVLTEKDIGRVFTRASDGQKYVLVKVPGTAAWFCPYDDEAMESGDFTKYGYPAKGLLKSGDILTYELDKREKTFSVTADATQEQFRYPSNHRVQHAYLNGTVEVDLTKDGAYNAEFVDFYETYDVLYLPSVLRALMKNVGENTNASHYAESLEDSYLTYIQHRRQQPQPS